MHWKGAEVWGQTQILLLPLACCVTLGQQPDFSGASLHEMGITAVASKMVTCLLNALSPLARYFMFGKREQGFMC